MLRNGYAEARNAWSSGASSLSFWSLQTDWWVDYLGYIDYLAFLDHFVSFENVDHFDNVYLEKENDVLIDR